MLLMNGADTRDGAELIWRERSTGWRYQKGHKTETPRIRISLRNEHIFNFRLTTLLSLSNFCGFLKKMADHSKKYQKAYPGLGCINLVMCFSATK